MYHPTVPQCTASAAARAARWVVGRGPWHTVTATRHRLAGRSRSTQAPWQRHPYIQRERSTLAPAATPAVPRADTQQSTMYVMYAHAHATTRTRYALCKLRNTQPHLHRTTYPRQGEAPVGLNTCTVAHAYPGRRAGKDGPQRLQVAHRHRHRHDHHYHRHLTCRCWRTPARQRGHGEAAHRHTRHLHRHLHLHHRHGRPAGGTPAQAHRRRHVAHGGGQLAVPGAPPPAPPATCGCDPHPHHHHHRHRRCAHPTMPPSSRAAAASCSGCGH